MIIISALNEYIVLFTDHLRKLSTSKESLISPASPASHGGVYAVSKPIIKNCLIIDTVKPV